MIATTSPVHSVGVAVKPAMPPAASTLKMPFASEMKEGLQDTSRVSRCVLSYVGAASTVTHVHITSSSASVMMPLSLDERRRAPTLAG